MRKQLIITSLLEDTQETQLETQEPQPEAAPNIPPDKTNVFVAGENCSFIFDKSNKRVDVWIYGPIRVISSYMKFINILHTVDADFEVHVWIHSPGGSIAIGCNILAAMERCKATIITHNLGMAASCGSLILAFGDKIDIPVNSTSMFHNALQGSNDSVHRILSQTQHIIAITSRFFIRMQERGLITESEIEGIVKRGEEYFLTGTEMISRLTKTDLLYQGAKS